MSKFKLGESVIFWTQNKFFRSLKIWPDKKLNYANELISRRLEEKVSSLLIHKWGMNVVVHWNQCDPKKIAKCP